MKTFFVIILLFISVNAFSQAYNTNALNMTAADTNGLFASPSNGIFNSLTGSNYAGGNWTISIGAWPQGRPNAALYATNYGTGASFLLSTNGHFEFYDQFNTKFNSGTNGVWSIVQTNGISLLETNGTMLITSNGNSYGSVRANTTVTPLGTAYPTNGAWSLFNVTNQYPAVPCYFWIGPSNRSLISLEYSNGTIWTSNLIYNP